jgi:hypothetical protein
MSNPNSSQTLWHQLVADYRQACWLRREGREGEANGIVNEKLPQSIALWSREDNRSATDKKAALETMFSSEQAAIDSWMFAHQMLANRLTESLIPALRQQVGEEMRDALANRPASTIAPSGGSHSARSIRSERIRFDDIPGVIDALLSQQAADYGARPALAYS